MKLKRFSLFVIFFSFSLFICLGSLKLTASASEEKKVTTYAVDFNGEYLDHGIGHFICRTTDSSCPKEIKERNSNYFVFEYIQNDEEKPSYDKYAVVNLSTLPEFVKVDILNPEVMFGIHEDGYWTETKTRYYTETIEYNALLKEYIITMSANSMTVDYGVLLYLDFLNVDIDEILSIDFSFNVYKPKRFLGFLWKNGFDKKTINSSITPDSIYVNGSEYKGDFYSLFGFGNYDSLSWNWKNKPIEKLDESFVYNDKSYEFKINTGYSSARNDDYFLTQDGEIENEFTIVKLNFLKED